MFLYNGVLLLTDVLLVNFAFYLALLLRFDFAIPEQYATLYIHQWFILTLIHLSIVLTF